MYRPVFPCQAANIGNIKRIAARVIKNNISKKTEF